MGFPPVVPSLLRSPELVIFPSRLRAEAEARRIVLEGPSPLPLLGPRFTTFRRLVEDLAPEAAPGLLRLDRLAHFLLIESVIAAARPAYFASQFRGGVPYRGFVKECAALFLELKHARIDPASFRAAVGKMPDPMRDKGGAIADLFEAAEARRRAVGAGDEADILAAVIESVRDPERSLRALEGVKQVRMEDVYDCTVLQFDLLVALSVRIGGTVPIRFQYNPDRQDAFRFVEPGLRRFEALGGEVDTFDPGFAVTDRAPDSCLGHVMKHLFRDAAKVREAGRARPDGTLSLIAAPGRYREIEEVGRAIRKRLEGGTPASSIAILARDLSGYGEIIEDVARRYRIPLHQRRGAPLSAAPLVRTLLALVETARDGFPRDATLGLLGNSYVDFPMRSPASRAPIEPARIERIVRDAGVLGERAEPWTRSLSRYARRLARPDAQGREPGEGRRRAISEVRAVARGLRAFFDLLRPLSDTRPLPHRIAALRQTVLRLRIPSRLRASADVLEVDHLRRDLLAWRSFERCLVSLETSASRLGLSGPPVDTDRFLELLAEAMDGVTIPDPPPDPAGVRVLTVHDARGLSFDSVFIVGCTEGSFPLRRFDRAVFSDEERRAFNDAHGVRVFRSLSIIRWEEPLLFYLALAAAEREVVCTFPNADSEGTPQLPSTFVSDILKLVDVPSARKEAKSDEERAAWDGFVLEVPADEAAPPLGRVSDSAELLHRTALDLFAAIPPPRPELRVALLGRIGRRSPSLSRLIEDLRSDHAIAAARERFFWEPGTAARSGLAGSWTGRLRDPETISAIARRHVDSPGLAWSPSALERYGACPFRYFSGTVLGLDELPEPTLEIDAMSRGRLVHRILELFYRERLDDSQRPPLDSPAAKDHLAQAAKVVCEEWERQESIGDPHFWALERRSILRALKRHLPREAEECEEHPYVPSGFEVPFGLRPGEAPGPVEIADGRGDAVRVRGVIDRIDVTPDGDALRVVDYKFSKGGEHYRGLVRPEALASRSFQMPAYLFAAEAWLRATGKTKPSTREAAYALLRAAKYLYVPLEKPDLADYSETDPEKWSLLPPGRPNFARALVSIRDGVRSGRFDVSPTECGEWFCPFRTVCRYVEVSGAGDEE